MSNLERRTFLKIAAGAAATTANFLYPGITKAAGARMEAATARAPKAALDAVSGPDPNMAFGTVVSKATNGVVLQYGTSKTYAVRISPDTVVWKEFDVTPDVIQLGDWLDVKGTLMADGTVLASSGWVFVNIGRREGTITQVTPAGLTFTHPSGGKVETMELSSKLDVITAKDGLAVPGHLSGLASGTAFGAVGLRLPNGGFRSTRIWV